MVRISIVGLGIVDSELLHLATSASCNPIQTGMVLPGCHVDETGVGHQFLHRFGLIESVLDQ